MGKKEIDFGNIDDTLVDDDAVASGVELSIGKGRFITITQAGAANRKYKAEMRRVFKGAKTSLGISTMDDDEADDMLKEVYAKTIVMGWKGFVDGENKAIPYTATNCIALFDASPRIWEVIQEESAKFSNFARGEIEDSGK